MHDDQHRAMLFAKHAAIAVENARLIEQAEGHAATIEQRVVERTQNLQDENDQRRRVEAHLTTLLKEKEVLLREVYHRVKNNLQVISSILNLQAGYYNADPHIVTVLKEIQSRVRSMALVHEKLYQTNDMATINFGDYVHNLVAMLFRMHDLTTETIQQRISITDVSLGLDTAVPCGLIINELVTNVLKYAFPDLRHVQYGGVEHPIRAINITMESMVDNCYTLTIADNGVGIPAELDIQSTKTLGLQLVVLLVEQLGGTIHVAREQGTMFSIVFSPIIYANRGGDL
ncbi:MAG: sensor histidine kinase [Chloroflexales bacterium]